MYIDCLFINYRQYIDTNDIHITQSLLAVSESNKMVVALEKSKFLHFRSKITGNFDQKIEKFVFLVALNAYIGSFSSKVPYTDCGDTINGRYNPAVLLCRN